MPGRIISIIALIMVMLSVAVANAGAQEYLGYNNGSNYLKLFSDHERATYVQGFINGITVHELFKDEKNYTALMQCTQGVTAGRIAELIRRYIQDHPDKAGLSLNLLTVYALNDMCGKGYK